MKILKRIVSAVNTTRITDDDLADLTIIDDDDLEE